MMKKEGMKYLNLTINEEGKKIKLHNINVSQLRYTQTWGKHKDRLYADYDFPKLNSLELRSWYQVKNQKNKMIFGIFNFDDELIGYISLRDIKSFFKTAELGIVLNPDKINKGYGTDAIETFIYWYFNKLKYKKLYLSVAMYNNRAYRVYKNLNFEKKYIFWDEFLNTEIDPLIDSRYKNIKQYFKKVRNNIYVKCIKMYLSTLSTEI